MNSLFQTLNVLSNGMNISFSTFSISEATTLIENEFDICSFLTANEQNLYWGCRIMKRKSEWLAGRLAAKQAVSSLLSDVRYNSFDIIRKKNGAPALYGRPDLFLSISHCREIAIAAISPFPVGIDIEYVESRPDSFLQFFFNAIEIDFINNIDHNEKIREITRLWTCKEAVVKAGEWGGSLNFKEINCCMNPVYLNKKKIYHRSLFSGSYAVTLASIENTGRTHG